ncbi:MAG: small multi-drug export protein [Verrucomicrobia bacterium]|nr:small multi-drug export protein [Verrucomicrobiota bacterium]
MNTEREIRNEIRSAFLRSREGPVFLVGCCMLVVWVAAAAGLWHAGVDLWNDVLAVGFAHLLAGRAISIVQGTQIGLPKWLIVLVATYADMTVTFLAYPLFVYTYENFFEGRFFQKRMRPMLESAERHMGGMSRFKVVGVFCFVWLPFWMTGIIVGSILGYLLGLRRWVTLSVVSLAALAAVASWVYAYDFLFRWLSSIHQEVPLVFTSILIVVVIWSRLARRRRASRSTP